MADLLNPNYQDLLIRISDRFVHGQQLAMNSVNVQMLETYWEIGHSIVEFEQGGKNKATYGEKLLELLSKDLKTRHGRGFSRSNLNHMRMIYLRYPICETLSHKLSWSHYVELLKIDDLLERSFYEQQSIRENWNVRELKRQKKSSLFLRLATSTDKEGILKLAQEGQIVQRPEDLIREPYVLEFLKIPAPYQISELELEKRLIEHLQHLILLLELFWPDRKMTCL